MEFNKISIFVSLLVLSCFKGYYAPSPDCTGCKKVNYLNYFPGSALEGVWYLNGLYEAISPTSSADCVQFKITKINCTAYNVEQCVETTQGSGAITCGLVATYSAADPIYPDGRFIITSPQINFPYELNLMDIQENYYAIFYGCQKLNSQTSYEEYFILTREGVVYGFDQCKFAKALDKNGLDSSKLKMIQQKGTCTYKYATTRTINDRCSS